MNLIKYQNIDDKKKIYEISGQNFIQNILKVLRNDKFDNRIQQIIWGCKIKKNLLQIYVLLTEESGPFQYNIQSNTLNQIPQFQLKNYIFDYKIIKFELEKCEKIWVLGQESIKQKENQDNFNSIKIEKELIYYKKKTSFLEEELDTIKKNQMVIFDQIKCQNKIIMNLKEVYHSREIQLKEQFQKMKQDYDVVIKQFGSLFESKEYNQLLQSQQQSQQQKLIQSQQSQSNYSQQQQNQQSQQQNVKQDNNKQSQQTIINNKNLQQGFKFRQQQQSQQQNLLLQQSQQQQQFNSLLNQTSQSQKFCQQNEQSSKQQFQESSQQQISQKISAQFQKQFENHPTALRNTFGPQYIPDKQRAIQIFTKNNPQFEVTISGYQLDPKYKNFSGCPDGIVIDKNKECVGILKIKIDKDFRTQTENQMKQIDFFMEYKDETFKIKKQNIVYEQVQTMLQQLKFQQCFFIYHSELFSILQLIQFDADFIKQNIA